MDVELRLSRTRGTHGHVHLTPFNDDVGTTGSLGTSMWTSVERVLLGSRRAGGNGRGHRDYLVVRGGEPFVADDRSPVVSVMPDHVRFQRPTSWMRWPGREPRAVASVLAASTPSRRARCRQRVTRPPAFVGPQHRLSSDRHPRRPTGGSRRGVQSGNGDETTHTAAPSTMRSHTCRVGSNGTSGSSKDASASAEWKLNRGRRRWGRSARRGCGHCC